MTMVLGYHKVPPNWNLTSSSEIRNAGSIVVRLQYRGKSILFCGDTVGRHIGDDVDALIAAEREMVENAAVIPIDSDVIIAPHHGADNGSSSAFIEAVSPEYVIFSAGHKHRHPRTETAQRYRRFGVTLSKMLRTDRGDDEGSNEWGAGRVEGHNDPRGDDDIDILIGPDGSIKVEYK